ncbi:MAG: DUF4097 family beta strand repeat-containing protein [Verrucomicrobiota bacterium]|nr:DUF4097 family beta strand repeat-containing protein [Verrucomicrobiota bacterium]
MNKSTLTIRLSNRLLAAASTVLLIVLPAQAATFTRTFEKSLPTTPGNRVELSSRYAEISTIPGDDTSVTMSVLVTVKASDEADAEQFFAAIIADLKEESGKVVGRVDFDGEKVGPEWRFRKGPELVVTLKVPATYNLDVRCTSGDVKATGIQGNHNLTSTSGKVSTLKCAGDHNLKTTSGDIQMNDCTGDFTVQSTSGTVGLKNCPGKHTLSSVSGDIRVRDGHGALQLKSTSGEILVENTPGAHHAKSSSGDIKLLIPGGLDTPTTVSSTSGDVVVKVPASSLASIALKTVSGNLTSDFAITSESVDSRKNQIKGTINGGGSLIEITTVSGDVSFGRL